MLAMVKGMTMIASHQVRLEVPLTAELSDQLIQTWMALFRSPFEELRNVLNGTETSQNRDIFYLFWKAAELAGTCHLTYPKADPTLGGLGEVATVPAFRGRGIASELCRIALQDFRQAGGEALFLGTGNPAAARVYRRLGWQKLAGANVWANILSGESPEAFLVNYFRESSPISVVPASPAHRIPMVPLILAPHDWQVLDANAGLFSTRYVVQNSCMGLYPRYERLLQTGRGTWFGAHTMNGRLVGLATVCVDSSLCAQVDGFTHAKYPSAWDDLIQSAIRWAAANQARTCQAVVSREDEEKLWLFEGLGFRIIGSGDEFNLEGRPVRSVRVELTVEGPSDDSGTAGAKSADPLP